MFQRFFYRLGLALTMGYILFFYSERVFWSFLRPEDNVPNLLLTWLIYSIAAYICLIVIQEFRVRNIWAMFIVGALFGWLVEGVFAMTLFGASGIPFPFTVSWTGLAWHALVSVLFGWYLLQKALVDSIKSTVITSIGLGVFWGLWAISWGAGGPSLLSFLSQALLLTAILIFMQRAYYVFHSGSFIASKFEKIILSACVLLWFFLVTIPTIGISALFIIPILFLIIYIVLRKNKKIESESNFLTAIDHSFSWKRSITVFLMPIFATAVYTIINATHIVIPIGVGVLLITTAIGFILFVISIWKILSVSKNNYQ